MSADAGLVERLEARADRKGSLLDCTGYKATDAALDREAAQRIRELEAKLAAETERCARVLPSEFMPGRMYQDRHCRWCVYIGPDEHCGEVTMKFQLPDRPFPSFIAPEKIHEFFDAAAIAGAPR